MKSRARGAGFTLIEVLVAMTVMATMAVMAWQGVDAIVRTRDVSQARLEQTLRLGSVMAQWEQDLASYQETAWVQTIQCDGSTVRLTRRAEGGMQVVAWGLRPDATEQAWWRWASPVVTTVRELQEHWLRTLQFQGGEPGQLRTLDGLSGWQVYFYRGNAWSNCQSSADVSAPAPAPPASGASGVAGRPRPPVEQLPKAIRMVLSFAPGSGLTGSITRDVLFAP